jgi:hypothetical protein
VTCTRPLVPLPCRGSGHGSFELRNGTALYKRYGPTGSRYRSFSGPELLFSGSVGFWHLDGWILALPACHEHLGDRYDRRGAARDFEEAIVLDREALDLCLQGHPDRGIPLNNLAVRLYTRYKQIGALEDLNEALFLIRKVLHLFPQGHPDRGISLCNLAAYLCARYKQLGAMEDLVLLRAQSSFSRKVGASFGARLLDSIPR